MNQQIKSAGLLLATGLMALGLSVNAWAQRDKQGKRSLETHMSRPAENRSGGSGAAAVQRNTQQRVQNTLSGGNPPRNSQSAQVQNRTRSRLYRTLK